MCYTISAQPVDINDICSTDEQVRVVAADGSCEGSVRVVDLGTGLHEVYYMAPRPGAYLIHVTCVDVGDSAKTAVHVRGSPFTVECSSPWTPLAVTGEAPAGRQVGRMAKPSLLVGFNLLSIP
jgi:hypothetical protein